MEVYRGSLLVFVCKDTDRFPFLRDVVRFASGRIPMLTRSMWLLQLVSTRNKNRYPSIFRGYIWGKLFRRTQIVIRLTPKRSDESN